ncbi:MAG: FAS1-like dehydratase domain-containing protein [Candidatus Dormibacteria bacterium]
MSGSKFRMPLEEGKVREYARSARSTSPEHMEGEHPMIHPFYMTCSIWWDDNPGAVWADLPAEFDPALALHAEQEVTFHGPPPRAGTVLTAEARSGGIRKKEGRRGGEMIFVDTIIEFRDPKGNLVVTERQSGVVVSHVPAEVTE